MSNISNITYKGVDTTILPGQIEIPLPISEEEVALHSLNQLQNEPESDTSLEGRLTPHSSKLQGFFNGSKALWELACTVTRCVLVLLAVPILYPIHLITRQSAPSINSTMEKTEGTAAHTLQNAPPLAATETKIVEHSQRPSPSLDVKKLEDLKLASRKKPGKREKYFKYFSKHIQKIFSFEKTNERMNGKADPDLVYASRESYINLNLVYRFDGPDMVGRTLTLLQLQDDGTEIPVEYKVVKYFQDEAGLVGYGLVPIESESAPPRLIFRGTNTSSYINKNGEKITPPSGIVADAAKEIGKHSFENQSDEIQRWLQQHTKDDKKAFVSGHSLGGAIAMRVAAAYPELVGEVYTLNSPRLEESAFQKPLDTMKITHAIMKGDKIVPHVGGGRFSPGRLLSNANAKVILIRGGGHTSKKLNNYCMASEKMIVEKTSIETYHARESFRSKILDFIRPDYVPNKSRALSVVA